MRRRLLIALVAGGLMAGMLPGVTSAAEFRGHRYEVFEDWVPWHDAVASCESIGAHLVTIHSAEENAFVYGSERFTWLGATDELVEGE